MISTDAAGTVLANAVNDNSVTRFWVSLYGGAMPTTPSALAGDWSTPLLTYKNIVATDDNDYAITWSTPIENSRRLVRDPTVVALGDGNVIAGIGTVATWMMIYSVDDDLSADTTMNRYAFSVGSSGTEVLMTNPIVVQGETKYLDVNFALTFNDPI